MRGFNNRPQLYLCVIMFKGLIDDNDSVRAYNTNVMMFTD